MDERETNDDLLGRLPAKFVPRTDRENAHRHPDAYHPLYCHMHDVAAVAGELWDHVLAAGGREWIASGLGVDEASARTWLTFLAGLHDLGKAAPAFLRHKPAHPTVTGLPIDLRPEKTVVPSKAPHGVVTAVALAELLRDAGVHRDVARRMAETAGGHHGFFPARVQQQEVQQRHPSAFGNGPGWRGARSALFARFRADLHVADAPAPSAFDNATAIFVAGLISVADWIGSDSSIFEWLSDDGAIPSPGALARYPSLARDRAARAIRTLGWSWRPPTADPTMQALFERAEPRGVQIEAFALAERLAGPSLTVIEAPTGDGKTEAALILADAFARRGTRGFYLALPTQATSNQLYRRAGKFLARAYGGDSDPVLLQLLHGHASLSDEFAASLARFHEHVDAGPAVHPEGIHDDEPGVLADTARVAAAEWFTRRKRGLLAPFGVGTVDQVLLAALQTRHVFVRLFGLAGKTVIVDEVHAYDAYMSTLLGRLLQWLAALGSPVVLLSATLPRARTRALIEAYAKGLGKTVDDRDLVKYPRITSWSPGTNLDSKPLEASDAAKRSLAWEWLKGMGAGNEAALAEWVLKELGDEGCAAVICNTVDRAQKVYRALRERCGGDANEGLPVDLFHARFPFEVRDAREKRALVRFGDKDAKVRIAGDDVPVARPTRAILVATQVIESSLDLDFDLMVTDLAPVDLLLQRAGRMHRHRRDKRPGHLSEPVLHVIAPEVEGDVPSFSSGDCAVYAKHVLLRTWLALRKREGQPIAVPHGVETLIEAVYGDRACPEAASDGLRALWDETAGEYRTDVKCEETQAMDRYIKPVSHLVELAQLSPSHLEEDSPEVHRAHQAVTRLADPSVQVVCLDLREDGVAVLEGEPIDEKATPDDALAGRLIRRSVTLSDKRVVSQLLDRAVPAGWKRSALLRHCRLLAFDASGRARLGGAWDIVLDPETGIEVVKAGTS